MKKKIYFGFALISAVMFTVFTASTSEAGGAESKPEAIKWYTIEEAQKLSDSIPRRIFIDFSTSWCGWCKRMDAETFANPIIAKYMNANYYCVKFDAESRDSVTFNGQKFYNKGAANTRSAHEFAITVLHGQLSYPSYAIFDKPRTHITIMQGYMSADRFEPYIHYYAEEKEGTVTFDDYLKTFKSELPKPQAPKKPDGPPQY
jgi:thioredoxin-related protein